MSNYLVDYLVELKNLEEEIVAKQKSRHSNETTPRPIHKKADYAQAKQEFQKKKVSTLVERIQKECFALKENINRNNPDNENLLKIIKLAQEKASIEENIPVLIELAGKLKLKSEDKQSRLSMPSGLPSEIKQDILSDFKELERCYNSRCFRACTIICGRIIETSLHRKYFEITQIDLLEKNPGIGLGKLIAKMAEKEIKLDPGLTQQIHLINQVRIYSVHKKSESFYPTKDQAYAMILYTLDVLEKMFKNA
ncbi:MAG: hypothetical protein ACQESF_07450 [Nanobdellota archaeon]